MISSIDSTPIHVSENIVAFDGHDQETGHPRVYLNVESNTTVICPYCSQIFTHDKPVSMTNNVSN